MNQVKKLNFKLFLTGVFVLVVMFSFASRQNRSVSAQVGAQIIMGTNGYAPVSISSYNFSGSYFISNFTQRRFTGMTVYFEYEKAPNNNPNFNFPSSSGVQETIKTDITRDEVKEFGDFYISANVQPFSLYYFRAVGYFNDDPSNKFYGSIKNFSSGTIPPNPNPVPPPTVQISAGSRAISFGGSTYISWSSTNTTSCTTSMGSGSWAGTTTSFFGTFNTGALTATTVYRISCKGLDGISEANDVTDVVVSPATGTGGTPTTPQIVTPYVPGKFGLVPCENDCKFEHFIELIGNVVNFLLKFLALPFAAIMFAYAGFVLVTSGGSTEKRGKAKKIFINVAIGLVLIAAAFLIVDTVLRILGVKTDVGWTGFLQ